MNDVKVKVHRKKNGLFSVTVKDKETGVGVTVVDSELDSAIDVIEHVLGKLSNLVKSQIINGLGVITTPTDAKKPPCPHHGNDCNRG